MGTFGDALTTVVCGACMHGPGRWQTGREPGKLCGLLWITLLCGCAFNCASHVSIAEVS